MLWGAAAAGGKFNIETKEELSYLLKAEQNLKASLDEDETHKYYLLTVEFGIKTYRAYLEWCQEAEKFLTDNKGNSNDT